MNKLYSGTMVTIAVLMLLSSGCRKAKESEEVNQLWIYTNYEMKYESATDLTTVKANFRKTTALGRQIKLTGGSNVRFNNQLIPEITNSLTNVTYYELQIPGFVQQGTFTWTDADGRVYNNHAVMRTADVPTDLNNIPAGSDYEFFWWGESIANDDRVQLHFNVNGGPNKTYTQETYPSESIVIPQSDLDEAAPGTAQLALERRHRPELTEKTLSGGRLTIEYFSLVKSVSVLE